MLDAATGATVQDEADEPGTAVVGEYDGVVLTAAHGSLAGEDATAYADGAAPVAGRTLFSSDGAAVLDKQLLVTTRAGGSR